MKYLIYLALFLFGTNGYAQSGELSGVILSENEPVPFANIYIEDLKSGTTTNEFGSYSLKNIPQGTHILQISAVGYETVKKEISIRPNQKLKIDFRLEISSSELSEVLIIDEQSGLARRTPYNVSTISMAGIENKGNPNGMMGILREVPGIYGAEFGQGIVKPFIRGLGFSRIVTIYQGNKLENHQWGADHGLGINDLGIKSVDVIKGPASVLYGSGALGGVLLSKDDDFYLNSRKLAGNAGVTFNSISNGLRTYGSLGKSYKNDMFFAVNAAYETHADYKNGAGRIIGNSRFNTQTIRLHTGIEKENFQNKLSLTYNNQNLGIISDEEMTESQSLATSRNDRDMQLPFQEVEDYLISYNQGTQNENLESFVHLSHHFNERKEIETESSLVDLGLMQHHTFYNFRLRFPKGKIKHSIGIQGSFKRNDNLETAQKFLIPDARTFESGIYYLSSLDLKSVFLQGALRYDYRTVTADATSAALVAYNFILPGNPENRRLTKTFSGITGSFGMTTKFNKNNTLKLNFSTGFRAPDLAELFSNGPHPGTSRFEKGNENFEREQSFQADANYSYRKNDFQGQISIFGSRINNYIFFASTDEIREEDGLEIWSYLQTDADFYGMEFDLKHSWLKNNRLETAISGAIVRASEKGSNENISFIPPNNYNAEISYFALEDRTLYLFSKLRLIETQNRVGFNEKKTPGYVLLNLGASKKINLKKNNMEIGITLYNALNKTYVDHMSILRAFNVSSPGRNLMLNLNYNF